jgi:hypothetical protein
MRVGRLEPISRRGSALENVVREAVNLKGALMRKAWVELAERPLIGEESELVGTRSSPQ